MISPIDFTIFLDKFAKYSNDNDITVQCVLVGQKIFPTRDDAKLGSEISFRNSPVAPSEEIFRGLVWHHHLLKISFGLHKHTVMPHYCPLYLFQEFFTNFVEMSWELWTGNLRNIFEIVSCQKFLPKLPTLFIIHATCQPLPMPYSMSLRP